MQNSVGYVVSFPKGAPRLIDTPRQSAHHREDRMMLGRQRWMVLVVTAMVGAIAGALSAQQFSLPMALGDAFVPDFYRRDLTAIDTELKLDAEQRAVVEALFADAPSRR
jgi:hypothetical protein